MKPEVERICESCKESFTTRHTKKIYCTRRCERRFHVALRKSRNPYSGLGLSPGTIGALSEMQAAADLMKKGWHVFRALSPSCPADLVIFKDSTVFKIEVKTAYRDHTGRIVIGKHSADYLAIVLPDRIIYEPDLP